MGWIIEMKTETLKKIVELADGFGWKVLEVDKQSIPYIQYSNISIFDTKNIQQSDQYPLLLRRAVEGWNRRNVNRWAEIQIGKYKVRFVSVPILE